METEHRYVHLIAPPDLLNASMFEKYGNTLSASRRNAVSRVWVFLGLVFRTDAHVHTCFPYHHRVNSVGSFNGYLLPSIPLSIIYLLKIANCTSNKMGEH